MTKRREIYFDWNICKSIVCELINQTYNEKYIWSININIEEYYDKIKDMMGCLNNFAMNVNILRKNNLGYNSFYRRIIFNVKDISKITYNFPSNFFLYNARREWFKIKCIH